MKILKLALLALFAAVTTSATAAVDIEELVAAVGENPDNCAALVEQAVRSSPEQLHDIVEALLAAYPELTEEIIFGAVAGMPTPLRDEVVSNIVERAILYRPALATDIAMGARRATTGMNENINKAAVRALRVASVRGPRRGLAPGQATAHAIPGIFLDGSILVSPAR